MKEWGGNMKTIVMIALAMAIPAMAYAGTVPKYDVEKFCEAIAKGKASIYNACIDMEQKAYDDVKKRWARIPDQIKDYCGAIASGANSYQAFIECEKIEKDAAKNKKSFQR